MRDTPSLANRAAQRNGPDVLKQLALHSLTVLQALPPGAAFDYPAHLDALKRCASELNPEMPCNKREHLARSVTEYAEIERDRYSERMLNLGNWDRTHQQIAALRSAYVRGVKAGERRGLIWRDWSSGEYSRREIALRAGVSLVTVKRAVARFRTGRTPNNEPLPEWAEQG